MADQSAIIKVNQGIRADWNLQVRPQAAGEIGLATDTREIAIGDGATSFAALPKIIEVDGAKAANIKAALNAATGPGQGNGFATINDIQNASLTEAEIAALHANTGLSAANRVAGLNDSAIAVQAIPANIFANPGASEMGVRFATITNLAEGKPPLYELYGTTGTQRYAVNTYGDIGTGNLTQEATLLNNANRKFVRQKINNAWGKWIEIPTMSFSPAALTIIVDDATGDDATANGTEAKPYKTIQAALNAIPKYNLGAVTVRIKAGTYNGSGSIMNLHGEDIVIESFSGEKDVTIVNSSIVGSATMTALRCGSQIFINNLCFRSDNPNDGGTGVYCFMCSCFLVSNCEFDGFRNNINAYRGMACVAAYLSGVVNINSCIFANAGYGISSMTCGNTRSSNNTSAGYVDYGLRAFASVIRKTGTQPAGTIANESISNGGQIV